MTLWDSYGSGVPVRALEQQTFERALDVEQRSQRLSCRPDDRVHRADGTLCLQYLESSQRCRDVPGA
jgi:hypothetical protein